MTLKERINMDMSLVTLSRRQVQLEKQLEAYEKIDAMTSLLMSGGTETDEDQKVIEKERATIRRSKELLKEMEAYATHLWNCIKDDFPEEEKRK